MRYLLFILFLSFQPNFALAESLEGKGLICKNGIKNVYLWFNSSKKGKTYGFNGLEIGWGDFYYYLDGTSIISIKISDKDKYGQYDFINIATWANVNRETLEMTIESVVNRPTTYNCTVVNSEIQILDEMNEIIKNAKKKNKI